jgi:hypothetical protein
MVALEKRIKESIKVFLRFFYYREERAKIFREPAIRKKQNKAISTLDARSEKLIVFLIEGADYKTGAERMSGGLMSIVSLTEVSRSLKAIHGAEVVLCTFPRHHLIFKISKFENNTNVFRFSQLADYFKFARELTVHIPEYLCTHFLQQSGEGYFDWMLSKKLHINILNQNIRHMASPELVGKIKALASETTITTAHQQYCNLAYRASYRVPLHKFSVWISPEQYTFKDYNKKKQLIVVSPDSHPERENILTLLSEIPGLEVRVIKDLTYGQYLALITEAKWTLTFGEGLDGYFIEPVFSGAVGFAVYNDEFFTSDFKSLKTIFNSFDEMKHMLVSAIEKLNDGPSFESYQKEQYAVCAKHYNSEVYRNNVAAFYQKAYTYA